MLARLMDNKYGIAVAGTHGKSTTASMISLLLERNGFDPTVVVGGELNNFKNNAKLGKGNHIVVEADESDGSFFELNTQMVVVTNIEDDNLDHYKNLGNILKFFRKFISNVPDNGRIILCKDCDNVKELVKQCERSYVSYGISTEADLMAKDIELDKLCSNQRYTGRAKEWANYI